MIDEINDDRIVLNDGTEILFSTLTMIIEELRPHVKTINNVQAASVLSRAANIIARMETTKASK